MSREPITGKSLMTAGAAAAFCGAALYATGQILSFLFRDVDPKRIAKDEEKADAIDTDQSEDQKE